MPTQMTRDQYRQLLAQRQQQSQTKPPTGVSEKPTNAPASSGWSMTKEPPKDNWLQSVVKSTGIPSLLSSGASAVKSTIELARGQNEEAAKTIREGVDVFGLGKVKPVGLFSESEMEKSIQPVLRGEKPQAAITGEGLKDVIGTGIQVASTIAGGGEAAVIKNSLGKATMKTLAKAAAKEGAVLGSASAVGTEMQKDGASLASTAISGLEGGAFGAALGFATPYAIQAFKGALGKGKGIWQAIKDTPSISGTVDTLPPPGGSGSAGIVDSAPTPQAESKLFKPTENVPVIQPKVKQQAVKSGLHPRLVELIETSSAKDREAMKQMTKQAGEYSESFLADHPSNVTGQTFIEHIKPIQKANTIAGKKLGQAVEKLPNTPQSVGIPMEDFMKSLQNMGIRIDDFTPAEEGAALLAGKPLKHLGFDQSSLSGTTARPAQKMLERAYAELKKGTMTPQRMHTLRQSIFADLGLGKEGKILDSQTQIIMERLRGGLGKELEKISPEYAKASKTYAITEGAIQSFEGLMGKKFGDVSEDVLKKRAAEIASRLQGGAPANIDRILSDIAEAQAHIGHIPESNLLRQVAFTDALREIFDITKPKSLQGAVEGGIESTLGKGMEAAKIGVKAIHSPLEAAAEVGMKFLGKDRSPEAQRKALKALLGMTDGIPVPKR
ncbi:MAG: hypothetical protein WC776_05035 [Patescibacteria group bacterium]|jgi:hypothetical protein